MVGDRQSVGVPAVPSGCQPTASAANASSQSGIPNAGRRVVRFGAGAASFIAGLLELKDHPEATIEYNETNAEHEDNERFIADCEVRFGKSVIRLSSDKFEDTWDVWERERYLVNFRGAPCSRALKQWPADEVRRPGDILIMGYTADLMDMKRAVRLAQRFPELNIETPLIKRGINKQACYALVQSMGIKLPAMYLLGFNNNNCIPCVKATSPNYWAAIRKHFPAQFERMVKLSRELDFPLARINDQRIHIDEIPADWPTLNPTAPACDFLCSIAEQDLGEAA